MKVVYGLENLKVLDKKSIITIGVFDGVHKGHQQIICKVVEEAKKQSLNSVLVTFDPHPAEIINPKAHPSILSGLNLKIHLIERLGVDFTLVIKFDKDFAAIPADEFLKEILVEKLKAAEIVVGEGFKFGAKAEGNINFLESAGQNYGFKVDVVSLYKTDDGSSISSTRIRNLLKEGKLDEAKQILGHQPIISGKVVSGRGYGKVTGFHTANVETAEKASIPKEGVYAGYALINSKKMPAVLNIGPSPTFNVFKKRIEVHILNYDHSLIGEELEVELIKRLRSIKKFEDAKALSAQIKKDIQGAKKILGF